MLLPPAAPAAATEAGLPKQKQGTPSSPRGVPRSVMPVAAGALWQAARAGGDAQGMQVAEWHGGRMGWGGEMLAALFCAPKVPVPRCCLPAMSPQPLQGISYLPPRFEGIWGRGQRRAPTLFQAVNAFEGLGVSSSRKEAAGKLVIDRAYGQQAEPSIEVQQHQEPSSLGSSSSGAAGSTHQMKGTFRQSSPKRANHHPPCSKP